MNIQKDLIKSANQIREKYRELKRGKYIEAEERLQSFQPLIDPLQELVSKATVSDKGVVPFQKDTPSMTPTPMTPSRIPITLPISTTPPLKLDFGLLASEYLGNYLNKNNITDSTYGIRREGNKFYIGDKLVEISNDDIMIGENVYKGTKGLWELLTLKEPVNYNDNDLATYKEILELTNGHLRGYRAGAPMSSNKHSKYLNIIKPLFKTTGVGLRQVTGNKIDYVYYDDVNEIVDRLRLLWLSKQAGNTGVDNEIDSILEELRESGIIY